MIRVYGITYDHTVNYGSILQSLALGEAIESLKPCGEYCEYWLIPVRLFPEMKSRSLKSKFLQPMIAYGRRSFAPFEREHVRYARSKSMKDLSSLNAFADVFVCGSDVIWNSKLNYRSNVFALDFANKYKFSYAASFGNSKPLESYLEELKPAVRALNEVSVRESSGRDIVKNAFEIEAEVVLDPVFLLSAKRWNEYAALSAHKKAPYIFVYVTHYSQFLNTLVEKIRKKTGFRVVSAIYAKPSLMVKYHKLRAQSPDLWLRQLIDADVVITNSFHCTAFSILFHKIFFTAVDGEKETGINVRMYDLLSHTGLSDRMVNSVPTTISLTEPSYDRADEAISDFRERSLEFLRRNLEAACREKAERGE